MSASPASSEATPAVSVAGPAPDSSEAGSAPGSSESAPALSVVKGSPTAEELAALTAVVLSLREAPPEEPVRPAARHWVRRAQLHLAPRPGPGAWRRGA
ncbi:MAG: acyl-CoA carboxylase subunit epsilon [Actinomycetales bacterium]